METSINNKYKAFTSFEQSKKLAEFLQLETADMYRVFENNSETRVYYGKIPTAYFVCEPCWSLASLLSVLPMIDFTTPQLVGTPKTLYRCMYNDNLKSPACDNPVDACVEMILKLYELKLL